MPKLPQTTKVTEGGLGPMPAKLPEARRGALAMLGFARRFRPTRLTEDWMAELRPDTSGDAEGSTTADKEE